MLNTCLGWIVSGKLDAQKSPTPSEQTTSYCGIITNQQLADKLEKFWKIEGCDPKEEETELEHCESLFISTHKRGDDGRYIVQMPLKDDISKLGDSKRIALIQLQRQLIRLQRNPILKDMYESFMHEYETLKHMEPVLDDDDNKTCYYLPHHGVLKHGQLILHPTTTGF